ncbi:hypothetical protein [Ruegeria sp. ANG-S4]|uniref:hypothetical protein n=1 Tax=Ruegeria sp. ANG-S4 TaxID=1577904 RepID=UPI00068D5D13|nr:hypothetical protein [Ruegeria sp. ANG-S4]
MFVVRNYVTMGGTVVCALAIGYLMQNGSERPLSPASEKNQVASTGQASVLAGLEGVTLTSSSASGPADTVSQPAQPARLQPSKPASCSLTARAIPAPQAAARLIVKAPCASQEYVQILHSGLSFTTMTDAMGKLDLTVPALSEYAIFLISLEDETGTVATTHVPDLKNFDRVAIQWQGDTELQLHALEFGASYGEDGHVWASPDASGAGLVTHLGEPEVEMGRQVQIYSVPSKAGAATGDVTLSVEAEVTETNCGSDLNVQALEIRGDRRLRSRDLTVTMPSCDTSEDFLVLNNLFEDLTIAAR